MSVDGIHEYFRLSMDDVMSAVGGRSRIIWIQHEGSGSAQQGLVNSLKNQEK